MKLCLTLNRYSMYLSPSLQLRYYKKEISMKGHANQGGKRVLGEKERPLMNWVIQTQCNPEYTFNFLNLSELRFLHL